MKLAVCFVAIVFPIAVGSIQVVVNAISKECLFLKRHKGEHIDFVVATDGMPVTITVARQNIPLLTKDTVVEYDHMLEITESDSYEFCFTNEYNARVVVRFEYDQSQLESDDKFSHEKMTLTDKAGDHARSEYPKLFNGTGEYTLEDNIKIQHEFGVALKYIRNITYHGEGKTSDDALKGYMTMIGIYMDSYETSLSVRKTHYRSEYEVQVSNNKKVMFRSILITCVVIIVAIVQLAMVKGFINGKISFKVWEY